MMNVFGVFRLGNDPELKTVNINGKETVVTSFSVANSYKEKGEQKTDWYRVTAWGSNAEAIAKSLSKGQRIFLKGTQTIRKYEKDGVEGTSVEIKLDSFEYIERLEEAPAKSKPATETSDVSEDEVPF